MKLGDDDKTPQLRTRSRGGDPRAIDPRQRHDAAPLGVPVFPPSAAPSSPARPLVTESVALLDREHLEQAELEIVKRSKRNSGDPAFYDDIVKLAHELAKAQRDSSSSNAERERQLDEILASPREIQTRLGTVEKTIKTVRRLLIAAVGTVATGVGTVATGILNSHDASIADGVRLERALKDVERLEGDIRDIRIQLGRRSELDAPSWPLPPGLESLASVTSKGITP